MEFGSRCKLGQLWVDHWLVNRVKLHIAVRVVLRLEDSLTLEEQIGDVNPTWFWFILTCQHLLVDLILNHTIVSLIYFTHETSHQIQIPALSCLWLFLRICS